MASLPEIKNQEYHEMGFSEVDKIREQLKQGEKRLGIKENELMLYLNHMFPKYSSRVKWTQNISFISLVAAFIFLFINWKVSPFLFILAIATHFYSSSLAKKYIFAQCNEDRVFLKFALAVGLVKLFEKD